MIRASLFVLLLVLAQPWSVQAADLSSTAVEKFRDLAAAKLEAKGYKTQAGILKARSVDDLKLDLADTANGDFTNFTKRLVNQKVDGWIDDVKTKARQKFVDKVREKGGPEAVSWYELMEKEQSVITDLLKATYNRDSAAAGKVFVDRWKKEVAKRSREFASRHVANLFSEILDPAHAGKLFGWYEMLIHYEIQALEDFTKYSTSYFGTFTVQDGIKRNWCQQYIAIRQLTGSPDEAWTASNQQSGILMPLADVAVLGGWSYSTTSDMRAGRPPIDVFRADLEKCFINHVKQRVAELKPQVEERFFGDWWLIFDLEQDEVIEVFEQTWKTPTPQDFEIQITVVDKESGNTIKVPADVTLDSRPPDTIQDGIAIYKLPLRELDKPSVRLEVKVQDYPPFDQVIATSTIAQALTPDKRRYAVRAEMDRARNLQVLVDLINAQTKAQILAAGLVTLEGATEITRNGHAVFTVKYSRLTSLDAAIPIAIEIPVRGEADGYTSKEVMIDPASWAKEAVAGHTIELKLELQPDPIDRLEVLCDMAEIEADGMTDCTATLHHKSGRVRNVSMWSPDYVQQRGGVVRATDVAANNTLPHTLDVSASYVATADEGGATWKGSAKVLVKAKEKADIALSKKPDRTSVKGGDQVTYDYEVTNPGTLPLTGVKVTDDKCTPVSPVGGDADNDAVLDPGEKWSFQCKTKLDADTTNTGTATATDPAGKTLRATATATVSVTAAEGILKLEKTSDKTTVRAGDSVTYDYKVTNPGTLPLTGVKVVDDKCTPVSMVGGDADNDAVLDPGEVWSFRCQMKLDADTTNAGTATATDPAGKTLRATDTATVSVTASPGALVLRKTSDKHKVRSGDSVTYTYEVTNLGTLLLTGVKVTDDKCTPVTLVLGAVQNNGLLGPGKAEYFRCETKLFADTTNTGTATATDSAGKTVRATATAAVLVTSADSARKSFEFQITIVDKASGNTIKAPARVILESRPPDTIQDGIALYKRPISELDKPRLWLEVAVEGYRTINEVIDTSTIVQALVPDKVRFEYRAEMERVRDVEVKVKLIDAVSKRRLIGEVTLDGETRKTSVPLGSPGPAEFKTRYSRWTGLDALIKIPVRGEARGYIAKEMLIDPALSSLQAKAARGETIEEVLELQRDPIDRLEVLCDRAEIEADGKTDCHAMLHFKSGSKEDISSVPKLWSPAYVQQRGGVVHATDVATVETLPHRLDVYAEFVAPAEFGGATWKGRAQVLVKAKDKADIALAKKPDRTSVTGGDQVTYDYEVTNPGTLPLKGVKVTDDKCTPVSLVGGDTNNNGLLDPGEVWSFRCQVKLYADTTNTGTATATDPAGKTLSATATATVSVTASPGGLQLYKTSDKNTVRPGDSVTYYYELTNIGNVPLKNVQLADDKCRRLNLIGGDTGDDKIMDPNENWSYDCTTPLNVDTTNVAEAQATDPAGGTATAKASHTVVVSTAPLPCPPPKVKVPGVVGQPETGAMKTLSDKTLNGLVVARLYHATLTATEVISQNPVADECVDPNSDVQLWISKGKEPAAAAHTTKFSVEFDCLPGFELTAGEFVGRICNLTVRGFTSGPDVKVEVDWNAGSGIEIFPGDTFSPPDLMFTAGVSDYNDRYVFSESFRAAEKADPGTTPVTITVSQAGVGSVTFTTNVMVLPKGQLASGGVGTRPAATVQNGTGGKYCVWRYKHFGDLPNCFSFAMAECGTTRYTSNVNYELVGNNMKWVEGDLLIAKLSRYFKDGYGCTPAEVVDESKPEDRTQTGVPATTGPTPQEINATLQQASNLLDAADAAIAQARASVTASRSQLATAQQHAADLVTQKQPAMAIDQQCLAAIEADAGSLLAALKATDAQVGTDLQACVGGLSADATAVCAARDSVSATSNPVDLLGAARTAEAKSGEAATRFVKCLGAAGSAEAKARAAAQNRQGAAIITAHQTRFDQAKATMNTTSTALETARTATTGAAGSASSSAATAQGLAAQAQGLVAALPDNAGASITQRAAGIVTEAAELVREAGELTTDAATVQGLTNLDTLTCAGSGASAYQALDTFAFGNLQLFNTLAARELERIRDCRGAINLWRQTPGGPTDQNQTGDTSGNTDCDPTNPASVCYDPMAERNAGGGLPQGPVDPGIIDLVNGIGQDIAGGRTGVDKPDTDVPDLNGPVQPPVPIDLSGPTVPGNVPPDANQPGAVPGGCPQGQVFQIPAVNQPGRCIAGACPGQTNLTGQCLTAVCPSDHVWRNGRCTPGNSRNPLGDDFDEPDITVVGGGTGGAVAGGIRDAKNDKEDPAKTDKVNAQCSTLVSSGGNQGLSALMQLGGASGPTTISYETYDVPDSIVVLAGGPGNYKDVLWDSGGCIGTNGSRQGKLVIPKGKDVKVFVTGACDNSGRGTAWNFTLACPAAKSP